MAHGINLIVKQPFKERHKVKCFLTIIIAVFCITCKESTNNSAHKTNEPKEILIYCENAMVPPLAELKSKFETSFNCKIKLHNDCSQNLASLIQYSLEGDIFVPASRMGFSKLNTSTKKFITDSVFVGYNPLVVMSAKSNPTNFSGELSALSDKKYAVIIANPETSSLGAETRRILEKQNLYNDIIVNVVALSTDSRGLVKSIKNDEAQLVINWKSDLLNNGNADNVEIFSIADSNKYPTEIYAGILSTSKNQKLAQQFLAYATGKEGINVFRKYGFDRRKSFIF